MDMFEVLSISNYLWFDFFVLECVENVGNTFYVNIVLDI